MSTMTEVVAAHYYMDDSKSHCECGYYAEWTPTSHAEHVAAELTKAGYGKLADAWDEGYMRGQFPWKKEAQEVDPIPDYLRPPSTGRNTNPYRSAS